MRLRRQYFDEFLLDSYKTDREDVKAMAGGRKGQSAVDDQNKKRKRDTSDAQSKSKRHRKDAKGAVVNGKGQKTQNTVETVGFTGAGAIGRTLPAEDNEADGGWRVSKPMGGRMLDIDPILTEDEQ